MTTRANIGIPAISMPAVSVNQELIAPITDTRVVVTAMSVHNTTVTNRLIRITEGGLIVASKNVPPLLSVHMDQVIGQGYNDTQSLIGVQITGLALAGDLIVSTTFTEYSGSSI